LDGHVFIAASCVALAIVLDPDAARFRDKNGENEISTGAVESNLAHPGEPTFPKTGAAGIGRKQWAFNHPVASSVKCTDT